jgi:hypothetical protein
MRKSTGWGTRRPRFEPVRPWMLQGHAHDGHDNLRVTLGAEVHPWRAVRADRCTYDSEGGWGSTVRLCALRLPASSGTHWNS